MSVTGGKPPFAFRWSSLFFDLIAGNAITVPNSKLSLEFGSAGLRWIYVPVTDAAGTAAAWIMPTGVLSTEFSYGVGLGTPTSINYVVRGVQ